MFSTSINNEIKMSLWTIISFVLTTLKFILANFLPILLAVVFYTLAERKAIAAIQRRLGPSYITQHGIAQPLADGVKALLKEPILPKRANRLLFLLAPCIVLVIGFGNWALIPYQPEPLFNYLNTKNYGDVSLSLFLLLAISSISVYGIILAGWASNSKYAFLGSIRSTAQMLSYEISLTVIIVPLIICNQTLNLAEMVYAQAEVWNVWLLWPLAVLFFIISLAETNRAPFDLPEAEAEIVAGYNIEYSGFLFAMYFLAEYSSMILISTLNVIFFWGGWLPITGLEVLPYSISFAIKISIYTFLFVLVRAALPRYRYDQLMYIGYMNILPLSLAVVVLVSSVAIIAI